MESAAADNVIISLFRSLTDPSLYIVSKFYKRRLLGDVGRQARRNANVCGSGRYLH